MQHIEHINVGDRKLKVRVLGSGNRNIIFFHGFPGSSSQAELFEPYLKRYDLRILSYDRPGYASSDPMTEKNISSSADDVEAIVKHFNLSKVEFISVSGGTPHALTAAHFCPDLVSKVGVFCGLGRLSQRPFGKIMSKTAMLALKLAPHLPGKILADFIIKQTSSSPEVEQKKSSMSVMDVFLPKSAKDQELVQDESTAKVLTRSLHEAFAQNSIGPQRDAYLYTRDWGWSLKDLKVPIYFWHGDDDKIIPKEMSELMSQSIPKSQVVIKKQEGHFSLPVNAVEEYLSLPN